MKTSRIFPSIFITNAKNYAIATHAGTNHMYDKYLPYEFHLRMVANNGIKFMNFLPDEDVDSVIAACYCHDLIEDARENYNSVLRQTNKMTAEIVRACTNYGRGRDREERMPDFIYKDIYETPHAVYVKLCDRIANAQYSKMTGSSMFAKYKKEHAHFKKMLYADGHYTQPLWNYLEEIFEIQ
jgi:(p)ppGpp synthase/HD superfamily hydrolase